jgi:hypothetical protein
LGGAEELKPPCQLTSYPKARADPFARREVASHRIVESRPLVDDFAHEAPFGASGADLRDTAAVDDRVGGNLGGCDEHVERPRFGHFRGHELAGEALAETFEIVSCLEWAEIA